MNRSPRRVRRFRAVAAVVFIGAFAYFLLTLPSSPRQLPLDPSWTDAKRRIVRGAFHVHSNRSDGTGTVDEIAAAAARAGLRFVILTDHGDATRKPDAPVYRSGVLCLDAVEISTMGGHYIAVDMGASPYPLGGEPRDVVEDVRRLGGFGVAAHPGSAKHALAWADWNLPIDGIEWLNADSEWRDEGRLRLARSILSYPIRPTGALASLLDRPGPVLARWDALTARRPVVGVAGGDAHARLSLGGGAEPYQDSVLLKMPSYEVVFRTFGLRVVVDRPLSGEGTDDAELLLHALRGGRTYTAIDALAFPALFEFYAQRGDARTRMGDTRSAGAATLHARVNAGTETVMILRRNGREVARGAGPELMFTHPGEASETAAYRVEVILPRAPGRPPVPWIVSNPIYLRVADAPPPTAPPVPAARESIRHKVLFSDAPLSDWKTEHEETSRAAVDARDTTGGGQEMAFRFALATLRRLGPYAALTHMLGESPREFTRLAFRARADRRMRLSVQLRAPHPPVDARWQRSLYLDETMREVNVAFDDMRRVGETGPPRPDLARVDAVLFVIDTVNTAPGTAGVVWLDDVRLEHP